MKAETKFATKVIAALRRRGAIVFNVHGSAYQQAGWPDLQVYHPRWTGHIELKVDKNKLSPLQRRRMEALILVGTPAVVVRLADQVVTIEGVDGQCLQVVEGVGSLLGALGNH